MLCAFSSSTFDRDAWRARGSSVCLAVFGLFGCSQQAPTLDSLNSTRLNSTGTHREALADYTDELAWSQDPPGLHPVDVPQFVAVTFDDVFRPDGMTWATDFLSPQLNPSGSAIAGTFDGTPVRTTFYSTCAYLADEWGMRELWASTFANGHETANHTVNHLFGGEFTAQNWIDEIAPCTNGLVDPEGGVGATVDDIQGFRSPYLSYNENLFAALVDQGLVYDTSIQNCWSDTEDGTNCAWPYTLDSGSPDADVLSAKFGVPGASPSPGLWEVPVSALIVPPDSLAAEYGFEPGLRARIDLANSPPDFYEESTGKIAPLDYTLFVTAGMTGAEALATLKYTLDLHLSGNRAPFVFIAHTHLYSSDNNAALATPEERRSAIEDFITYALARPEVRMRPVRDILSWMREPVPLNGTITMPIDEPDPGTTGGVGGTGGTGGGPIATGGDFGSGGVAMSGGTGGEPPPVPASQATNSGCRCGTPLTGGSSGWPVAFCLAFGWVARRARYFKTTGSHST